MKIVEERAGLDLYTLGNQFFDEKLMQGLENIMGEPIIWYKREDYKTDDQINMGSTIPRVNGNSKFYNDIYLTYSFDNSKNGETNIIYILSILTYEMPLEHSFSHCMEYLDADVQENIVLAVVEGDKINFGVANNYDISDLEGILNQTRKNGLESAYIQENSNYTAQIGSNATTPIPTFVNNSITSYALLGYSADYYYLARNENNKDFAEGNVFIKVERGVKA